MNPTITKQGTNYTATELGPIDAWKGYTAEVTNQLSVVRVGRFCDAATFLVGR